MSVVFKVEDQVAYLTLSRPEVMNAIDHRVLDGIESGLRSAVQDPAVKVVVVSGAGDRAFCAGADLALVRSSRGAEKRRYIERAYSVLEAIAAVPLPTIAALHGYVLGGGLEMALACDLRIAQRRTTFGLPEVSLGSVPSFGAVQLLPRVVGHALASELLFTSKRFNAEEALQMGLISRVVDGDVAAEAALLAQTIAANSREALRYAKIGLRGSAGPQLASAFHGLLSDALHASPEYEQNTRRFSKA